MKRWITAARIALIATFGAALLVTGTSLFAAGTAMAGGKSHHGHHGKHYGKHHGKHDGHHRGKRVERHSRHDRHWRHRKHRYDDYDDWYRNRALRHRGHADDPAYADDHPTTGAIDLGWLFGGHSRH